MEEAKDRKILSMLIIENVHHSARVSVTKRIRSTADPPKRDIWHPQKDLGIFFILLWSALSEGIKTGIGFPCDNPRPLRKHKVSESLALFHSPFFYAHQYLDLSREGMFGLF